MSKKFTAISYMKSHNLTFYLDQNSNVYYSTILNEIYPLQQMPWKYQLPFYLTFLHDDKLSERFKDMEIVGAIDLYIKWKFCIQEELTLVCAQSSCA